MRKRYPKTLRAVVTHSLTACIDASDYLEGFMREESDEAFTDSLHRWAAYRSVATRLLAKQGDIRERSLYCRAAREVISKWESECRDMYLTHAGMGAFSSVPTPIQWPPIGVVFGVNNPEDFKGEHSPAAQSQQQIHRERKQGAYVSLVG